MYSSFLFEHTNLHKNLKVKVLSWLCKDTLYSILIFMIFKSLEKYFWMKLLCSLVIKMTESLWKIRLWEQMFHFYFSDCDWVVSLNRSIYIIQNVFTEIFSHCQCLEPSESEPLVISTFYSFSRCFHWLRGWLGWLSVWDLVQ